MALPHLPALIGPLADLLLESRRQVAFERDEAWAWVAARAPWQREEMDESRLSALPPALTRYLRFALPAPRRVETVAFVAVTAHYGWRRTRCREALAVPFGVAGSFSSPAHGGHFSLREEQAVARSWRLGLLERARESSPDAAVLAERAAIHAAVWLPDALLTGESTGMASDGNKASVSLAVAAHRMTLTLTVDDDGRPRELTAAAAGAPSRPGMTAFPEAFARLEGRTLPTVLRYSAPVRIADTLVHTRERLDGLRYALPWIGSGHS